MFLSVPDPRGTVFNISPLSLVLAALCMCVYGMWGVCVVCVLCLWCVCGVWCVCVVCGVCVMCVCGVCVFVVRVVCVCL